MSDRGNYTNFLKRNPGEPCVARPYATLRTAIKEAIKIAQEENREISFSYSYITITVNGSSSVAAIARDWLRVRYGYITSIKPDAKAELSDSEKQSDIRIRAEQEAARVGTAAHRRAIDDLLAVTPEIEFSNDSPWLDYVITHQGDEYQLLASAFAERLARLVQYLMGKGQTFEQAAEVAITEVDFDHLMPFMQYIAVGLLEKCWTHGAQLSRWYASREGEHVAYMTDKVLVGTTS